MTERPDPTGSPPLDLLTPLVLQFMVSFGLMHVSLIAVLGPDTLAGSTEQKARIKPVKTQQRMKQPAHALRPLA